MYWRWYVQLRAMPNYFVSGTNTKLLTYFVMLPRALCSHETPMGEAIYFHVYISALLFSKIDIEDLFHMFLLHPAGGLIAFPMNEQMARHTKHSSAHLNDSFCTLYLYPSHRSTLLSTGKYIIFPTAKAIYLHTLYGLFLLQTEYFM